MLKENINIDMYTNIYVTVDGAKELNTTSSKYEDAIEAVQDDLEAISEERREARYNQLYDSANSKIQDAQKELDDEKAKAEKELEDAEKEIDDGKKEIEDGKAEIESNRNIAYSEFAAAEEEIEQNLEVGKVNILKVGHHGSDTSSSENFLQKIAPEVAIISVGEGNSYGHPSQTVLDRLEQIGSKVYRTDEVGNIWIEQKNKKLKGGYYENS